MSVSSEPHQKLRFQLEQAGIHVAEDQDRFFWQKEPELRLYGKLLPESMEALCTLQEQIGQIFSDKKIILDVRRNRIGDLEKASKAYAKLLEMVQSPDTPVGQLELRGFHFGGEELSFPGLVDSLAQTRIEMVSLNGNEINDSGAELIAEAIKTNAYLRQLDLEDNQIGVSGAKALAQGVAGQNCGLASLSIADNPITYEGAKALVEAAGKANSLRHLRFSRVNFKKGAEAKAIMRSMKRLGYRHQILRVLIGATGSIGRELFGDYRFRNGTCNAGLINGW